MIRAHQRRRQTSVGSRPGTVPEDTPVVSTHLRVTPWSGARLRPASFVGPTSRPLRGARARVPLGGALLPPVPPQRHHRTEPGR